MHFSAIHFSQDSPCLRQCHLQHDWEKPWLPLCSKGQAYPQDTTSHERALERSSTGASSSRISSSRPRVWKSWHFSLPTTRFLHHLKENLKQPKRSQCLRLSKILCRPLTNDKELNWVHFRDETSRELDWRCQSIPWLLYTIIEYVHVCGGSTNTV